MSVTFAVRSNRFLSTPSARRATVRWLLLQQQWPISIHALREEGDASYCPGWWCRRFLSTPSARRATYLPKKGYSWNRISIHALREEGDVVDLALYTPFCQFLSTPSARRATKPLPVTCAALKFLSTPSARRATSGLLSGFDICYYFYPRPPRGGRQHCRHRGGQDAQFLSTPSARRATAKTETKSLFSNKLYNILHEFRRALIYNGSKNYPNHAK